MRILIAGCNGLLGQNLLQTAPGGARLIGLGLEPKPAVAEPLSEYLRVDITDRSALLAAVDKARPDRIVNAAAMTDVDGCERNPDVCDRLNRDAVGFMAETGLPLTHVSTDFVFDGENGPYTENDPVGPLNHYGRGKLESEALALSGSPRSVVLRTLWLWGLSVGGKKTFTEFVVENLAAGKPVRIVTDQIGNPTLALDLALAVWALMRKDCAGIYHAAGADRISRFDWAVAAAEFHGLNPALVQPVLTADLRQFAKRPLNSGLRCDKLGRDADFRPRGLHAQLEWMRDAREHEGS